MKEVVILWDLEDDEEGNVQHIAEHGVTMDEVEEVLLDMENEVHRSRTSGYPITFGYTSEGRFIAVVFEHVDSDPLTFEANYGIRRA